MSKADEVFAAMAGTWWGLRHCETSNWYFYDGTQMFAVWRFGDTLTFSHTSFSLDDVSNDTGLVRCRDPRP